MTVSERFMGHVSTESKAGCWLWTGADDGRGYGQFSYKGRTARAHRVAYELFVGPIPSGLVLDHLCLTTRCVNPQHLEPVTQQENNVRCVALIKNCPAGHPYTESNVYINGSGNRLCRECNRERARVNRKKNQPQSLEYQRKYREANRERQREYMKQYHAKKRAEVIS